MASLVLHNVPEPILKELERRAQAKQSSLEKEAIEALGDSLTPQISSLTEALGQFMAESYDHEQPYVDPFEGIRGSSSGREENPWES